MNAITTETKLALIPIDQLSPHPDNRPLGLNQEVIEQIKASISHNGFFQEQALSVREFEGSYQIIKGEHRFEAAKQAGVKEIPCYVYDWDDTEARIQILIGNIQTGNSPIDIGLAALAVVQKDSKKGYSAAKFGERLGISDRSIQQSIKSARVWKHVKEQSETSFGLLNELVKLYEISKTPQSDWLWLHDYVRDKELSKKETIELCRRVRDIVELTKEDYFQELFDLYEVKKGYVEGKREYKKILEIISSIAAKGEAINEVFDLYTYNTVKDEIEKEKVSGRSLFISELKKYQALSLKSIAESLTLVRDKIRHGSKENAEKTALYYRDAKNEEERIERIRLEKESREFKTGEWWAIGNHKLYCGDNRDDDFVKNLPDNFAIAFADPPYNEDVAEWDNDFVWSQDYLQDKAKLVFVTPGISQVKNMLSATNMNYRWSLSTWISNGMTRSAIGFGNWIMTLLFSKEDSIHFNAQDFNKISIQTSNNSEHYHKGEKPDEYMDSILERFSDESDMVVDTFLGSGTTLFRAHKMDRVCYGAERDVDFFKMIIENIENITGDIATKI